MALTRKLNPTTTAPAPVATAAPKAAKVIAPKATPVATAEGEEVSASNEGEEVSAPKVAGEKRQPKVSLFRTKAEPKAAKVYEEGDRLPKKEFIKGLKEQLASIGLVDLTEAGTEKIWDTIEKYTFSVLTNHSMKLMGSMVQRKISSERFFFNPSLSKKIIFAPAGVRLAWKYFFSENIVCYEDENGSFVAGREVEDEKTKEVSFIPDAELTVTLAEKWAEHKAKKLVETAAPAVAE